MLKFLSARGAPFNTLSFAFLIAISSFAWLFIPAVDFDESLYLEIARTMHVSGDYLQPRWDNQERFDKPPTFMWTLLPFSGDSALEILPGFPRIVSVLSTLIVAFSSAFLLSRRKRTDSDLGGTLAPERLSLLHATALCFAAFAPTISSGLLLIDLIMSLCLFPVFLCLRNYFNETNKLRAFSFWEVVTMGVCISSAAALKGLIAWIIPGLAVIFYFVFQNMRTIMQDRRSWLSALIKDSGLTAKRFFPVFVLAAGLSLAFYFVLYLTGHRDFVEEFFLQHHMSRGTVAMEGHSGPFFYHILIVVIGGGWLSAAILKMCIMPAKKSETSKPFDFFSFIWFLTPILFFSFVATKLPNYTWPAWMALPFVMASMSQSQNTSLSKSLLAKRLTHVCIALLGSCYLLAGILIALIPFILHKFNHMMQSKQETFSFLFMDLPLNIDRRVEFFLSSSRSMNSFEIVSSLLCALPLLVLGFLIFHLLRAQNSHQILNAAPKAALLNILFLIFFIFGLSSYPKSLYQTPIAHSAEFLSREYPELNVLTFGIKSPTFSSHYSGRGYLRQVNSDSNAYAEWNTEPPGQTEKTNGQMPQLKYQALVVPAWNAKGCKNMQSNEIQKFGFLTICLRPQ